MNEKLIDVADRALNTFAQGCLSVFTVDSLNIWSADWKTALGVGAMAAALSVLKSAAVWSSRRSATP